MASHFDPSDNDGLNDINITPFVDVVLVLLVIFMVTAPMMAKEALDIKLPQSKSSDKSKAQTISVGISKSGQILLNGQLIDLDLLYEKALGFKKSNPDIQVMINADKESLHGDVIKVLDRIKLAGINNFAFEIEKIVNE